MSSMFRLPLADRSSALGLPARLNSRPCSKQPHLPAFARVYKPDTLVVRCISQAEWLSTSSDAGGNNGDNNGIPPDVPVDEAEPDFGGNRDEDPEGILAKVTL